MKKILKLFLLALFILAVGFFALLKLLDVDLTSCHETIEQNVLLQSPNESKIASLYARMYANEFDLNYNDVLQYVQLVGTTTDFTVGHVYFRTPQGAYLACGWYK